MEEDIKIAKEFFYRKYTFMGDELSINISTILNRLEQDEKVIKEIAREIYLKEPLKYNTPEQVIDYFRKKCE